MFCIIIIIVIIFIYNFTYFFFLCILTHNIMFDASYKYCLCFNEIELVVIIKELEYNMNIKKTCSHSILWNIFILPKNSYVHLFSVVNFYAID